MWLALEVIENIKLMFLEPTDLGQVIYGYQTNQITEGNNDIVLQAIYAGIEEAKSYLTPNTNSITAFDGKLLYDVEAIFGATGLDRNALILQHTATIAKWHLIQLCNADIIYQQAKESYDRAVSWLMNIAKGIINLSSLPQLTINPETEEKYPFYSGSRTKFNHDY